MSASDRGPSRPAPPWGLVAMIGLMVMVEGFIARHPLDFTGTASMSWGLSGRAALREAKGCEVLCFGDSLVKHGIIPRIIEGRTGRPTYNLSVCAAQAPAAYFLLRRAIESGARPGAAIVDYTPDLLAGGVRDSERNWPELASWRECLDLAWTARDPQFLTTTALGMLLPSTKSRFEIRASVAAALRGESASEREATRVLARNWEVNRGAQFTPKNPRFDGHVTEAQQRRYLSQLWWCNKINRAYIARFLDLAARHEIAVYLLLPPVSPEIQGRRDRTGADAAHTEFVRELQSRYKGLTVLDARRSGYDHTVFFDPIHLDGQGAYTLSTDVAAVLRHHLADAGAGPRWVDLPAYRPLPFEIPLEDVDQSRIAVLEGDGGLRR